MKFQPYKKNKVLFISQHIYLKFIRNPVIFYQLNLKPKFQVVIVVCIILYYERASQKKSNLAEADEGDEFIAAEAKKEES